MEPLNCTIEPVAEGVVLHDACQFPALAHPTVAGILGLDPARVEIRLMNGYTGTIPDDAHPNQAVVISNLVCGSAAPPPVPSRSRSNCTPRIEAYAAGPRLTTENSLPSCRTDSRGP